MSGDAIQRVELKGTDGNVLPCQFNPSTLQISKTATWHAPPTRGSARTPNPQFIGTGPETLTAKLLFDGFDTLGGQSKGVLRSVSQLLDWCCVPAATSGSTTTPQPPVLTFSWGTGITFSGFLKRVNAEYTMFAANGTPLRATAQITLQTVPAVPAPTNPSSGGISGRTSAVLADCDSLAAVAYREYGDPGLWRAVALANGIEDPARVPVGTRLLVPPRNQATALSASGGELDGGR